MCVYPFIGQYPLVEYTIKPSKLSINQVFVCQEKVLNVFVEPRVQRIKAAEGDWF